MSNIQKCQGKTIIHRNGRQTFVVHVGGGAWVFLKENAANKVRVKHGLPLLEPRTLKQMSQQTNIHVSYAFVMSYADSYGASVFDGEIVWDVNESNVLM